MRTGQSGSTGATSFSNVLDFGITQAPKYKNMQCIYWKKVMGAHTNDCSYNFKADKWIVLKKLDKWKCHQWEIFRLAKDGWPVCHSRQQPVRHKDIHTRLTSIFLMYYQMIFTYIVVSCLLSTTESCTAISRAIYHLTFVPLWIYCNCPSWSGMIQFFILKIRTHRKRQGNPSQSVIYVTCQNSLFGSAKTCFWLSRSVLYEQYLMLLPL